jgi:hypothetical protein
MAVNPFRTSIRRLTTTARRAAASSSSYASTAQEMTAYHVQVSSAQGVADSLTGGKSSRTFSSPNPPPLSKPQKYKEI